MPRSFELLRRFKLPAMVASPQLLVRSALGVLLLANIVAAGFAFHWWNASPQAMERKLEETRRQLVLQRNQLTGAKMLGAKVEMARNQGGTFMANYMTARRVTYSTLLNELNSMASAAGIKSREASYTRDPVEGSRSMSQLTITASYEAAYPNLLKFVNLLDKSQRFLIIESLQAAPQPNGVIIVTIKLDAFVRDDLEDSL